MKPLKIERMGDDVQGVRLYGDPKIQPEPLHFRVALPFGDVDITRCSDGQYWVHLRVNKPERSTFRAHAGVVTDARIDAHDKHAGTLDASVLDDPQLYHLAVKLGPA